jgi:iron complex transport system substrate-binding protein
VDIQMLRGHPEWRRIPAVQSGRVYVVDGSQYFSRPGPRLVDSLEILAHILHPLLHPSAPARIVRLGAGGVIPEPAAT